MATDIQALLKLEVPIIVVLGRRQLPVRDVVGLLPGAIIEIPKNADEDLELLANNKAIGLGKAVKVGENFGIRLSFVGELRKRLEAMGSGGASAEPSEEEVDADALAAAMLAGQI